MIETGQNKQAAAIWLPHPGEFTKWKAFVGSCVASHADLVTMIDLYKKENTPVGRSHALSRSIARRDGLSAGRRMLALKIARANKTDMALGWALIDEPCGFHEEKGVSESVSCI